MSSQQHTVSLPHLIFIALDKWQLTDTLHQEFKKSLETIARSSSEEALCSSSCTRFLLREGIETQKIHQKQQSWLPSPFLPPHLALRTCIKTCLTMHSRPSVCVTIQLTQDNAFMVTGHNTRIAHCILLFSYLQLCTSLSVWCYVMYL